ncbi:ANR family transcriptional regulator [Pectobacterium brasiliense]|uniref:ANR family transcriptional regulator n=1 Tax=Pectobacterium TaxID=122277 RepID=UPI0010F9453F|nr:ANR family transcriptional regulator [Pectobacterium versatile]MBN3043465.1 ANR family transcriptional regulator [Pectobacterium brasiliense]TKY81057.1 ANR family transcriptional regulator [Pectobacterium polonicum]
MNTAYLTAANHAAAYERAHDFTQAKMMWLAALRHANTKDSGWCELRAEFCDKWVNKIEVTNG